MATVDDHTTYREGDQARQGETGHHVRYILGLGLIGALAAFAAVVIIA